MFLFAVFFFFLKQPLWENVKNNFFNFSRQYIVQFLYSRAVVCSVYSKILELYGIYSSKDLTLQVKCMKISPDIIIKTLAAIPVTTANVENFFVCWDKILEDTVQNNV